MKRNVCMIFALGLVCALIGACGKDTVKTTNSNKETPAETSSTVSEASETESGQIIAESNYQITRDIYGVVADSVFGSECSYTDIVLDEKGNVVSEKISGSNYHTMSYEYDSNNRIIRALKETQLYGTEEIVCTYDDKGAVTELHNLKTEKSGKVIESIYTYVYNDAGEYVSGQHIRGDGKKLDIEFENDESGRVIKATETLDGKTDSVSVYSYDDGGFNPIHVSTEKDNNKGYEEDFSYDENGRLVYDAIEYKKDGDTTAFECAYDVVGEVTETPESNPELIPADQWAFLDNCPLLPVPSSCIASIQNGDEENTYVLPTYKGCFFYSGGYPSFMPYILDSSNAMTAMDQYTSILDDVLAYDVQHMGNIIKISKDDKEIATLNLEIINGIYTLTVIPT